jgi:hypothetical protein
MVRTREQVEKEVDGIEEGFGRPILRITEWHTPCTDYPEVSVGTASIKRRHYHRGYIYPMEGVGGYSFWATLEPIDITTLQIGGGTWMTDEPINWIGMQRIAEASRGKVLVGGLGLGMICHALVNNDRVTKIDVVERCTDVIKLIKPQLRITQKIKIEEGDFWNYTDRFKDYDTIIIDLWVGKGNTKMWAEMMRAFAMCKVASHGKATVYIWGTKDPTLNPAIK